MQRNRTRSANGVVNTFRILNEMEGRKITSLRVEPRYPAKISDDELVYLGLTAEDDYAEFGLTLSKKDVMALVDALIEVQCEASDRLREMEMEKTK